MDRWVPARSEVFVLLLRWSRVAAMVLLGGFASPLNAFKRAFRRVDVHQNHSEHGNVTHPTIAYADSLSNSPSLAKNSSTSIPP